ncbi:MAG: hypothetical protein MHPSP_001472, partial [Paramarteilia canceri]
MDNIYPLPLNIVLNYTSGEVKKYNLFLDKRTTEVEIDQGKTLKALRINEDCSSMMLYSLDKSLRELMAKNFDFLTDQEKSYFFANQQFLMQSNKISSDSSYSSEFKMTLKDQLEMLSTIDLKEQDENGKVALTRMLNFILDKAEAADIEYPGSYEKVKRRISKIIMDRFEKPKFELNSSMKVFDYLLQISLLRINLKIGDKEVIKKFLELFDQFQEDPSCVHESLIPLLYLSKVQDICRNLSGEQQINSYRDILNSTLVDVDSRTRTFKLRGIGAGTPEHLVDEYMEKGINGRLQDLFYYGYSLQHPRAIAKFSQFISSGNKDLQKLPLSSRIDLVSSCSSASDQKTLEILNEMLEKCSEFAHPRIFSETIEKVHSNIAFLK